MYVYTYINFQNDILNTLDSQKKKNTLNSQKNFFPLELSHYIDKNRHEAWIWDN